MRGLAEQPVPIPSNDSIPPVPDGFRHYPQGVVEEPPRQGHESKGLKDGARTLEVGVVRCGEEEDCREVGGDVVLGGYLVKICWGLVRG